VDPKAALERFWVEKGADTPSSQGTHLDALSDGDSWQGSSSTYARPEPNRPREMIPYLLVDEPGGERLGWYVGIEFSGRTRITLERSGASLRARPVSIPCPDPTGPVCRPAPLSLRRRYHRRIRGWAGWRRQYPAAMGAGTLNNPVTLRAPSYR